MPCKYNLVIYDELYRTAVLEFGLWDQVRVDHGKEFSFMFMRNCVLDVVMELLPHMPKQHRHATML